MNKEINLEDVLNIARGYEVDQYDILETFLCDLLNVSSDRLYEILEQETDEEAE